MATRKTKTKTKTKRPIVKGPQLKLSGVDGQRTPRLLGSTATGKRLRYVEPPAKRKGNPFVAVRIARETHAAFLALCKREKVTPADKLRALVDKAVA